MSDPGRLEEQGLAELLRELSRREASGKLTLTRRDGRGVLAFRAGRIIYAASSSMRESFGHLLVLRGLLRKSDLLPALERQRRARPPRRLGQVLVEMGKVDEKALREVMRQQTEEVVRELLRWRTGSHHFVDLTLGPGGEVDVDEKDFVLAEGLRPQEILGDTAPPFTALGARSLAAASEFATGSFAAAPGASPRVSAGTPRPPALPSEVVSRSAAPAPTAEVTLRLMRYASQIVNRGVLFVVRPGELRGIGQFGVPGAGRSASDQVRETVVPLRDPSVLRDVVEARQSFQGPLDGSPGNRHLVHRLGGADPAEVVVVPLVVGGEVALVLYGDNLPERRAIGPVDALEFMVSEAALAMERGLPEEGERALTERRPE